MGRFLTLAVLFLLCTGCAIELGADSDGDGDSDVDSDSDSDGDGDGDYVPPDVGGDDWPEPDPALDLGEGPGAREALDATLACLDGFHDDSSHELNDCETASCLADSLCCRDIAGSWVRGDFDTCSDLSACGWGIFAAASDGLAVSLSGGDALLTGDGIGEVGLFSQATVHVSGEPTASFVGNIDAGTCDRTSCRQALGVAFSQQASLNTGTGVEPHVGLVLDGEQQKIHLYAAGRRFQSVAASREELTTAAG